MTKFRTWPGSGHYICIPGPDGEAASAYTLAADAEGIIETNDPAEIAQLRASGVLTEIVETPVPDKMTVVQSKAFDKKGVVKPKPADVEKVLPELEV